MLDHLGRKAEAAVGIGACHPAVGCHDGSTGANLTTPNLALVSHSVADILRARMLAIACGHEDGDDLDHLRTDPGFKLAWHKFVMSDAIGPASFWFIEEVFQRHRYKLLASLCYGAYFALTRRLVLDRTQSAEGQIDRRALEASRPVFARRLCEFA